MLERLQKILSARGIASRRKAEEYIERGLVSVNGKVAKIGDKADPTVDRVEVKGEVLEERQEMLYYVMEKPVGVVTSNVEKKPGPKPEGSQEIGRTVRDILPQKLRGKIFPVGRLDKESAGLLIFTNDGVLAYRLTHPSFFHEKEYEVTVDRPILGGIMKKLENGLMIDGSMTKAARVKRLSQNSFSMTITEGRNRQIRRMCQKVGWTVTGLRRTRITSLKDTSMQPGQIRPLTESERVALLASVGL